MIGTYLIGTAGGYLILLQKRLADRDAPIQLEKTGRGRFALNVSAKLELHEVAGSGRR